MNAARDAIFVYNLEPPESLASLRLMALIPARQLGARALYFGAGMDPDSFLDQHQPRALCLTKMFDTSLLQLAERAKACGVRLISVFCDWYFDGDEGRANRVLSDLSDAVVVQTRLMAEEFERHFGKRPVVIEEVMEYPRAAPRFAPGSALRIVWYGRHTNFDSLLPGLRKLARFHKRLIHVLIVSNEKPVVEAKTFDTSSFPSNLIVDYEPWSLPAQHQAVQSCDFVFVPGLEHPAKHVKGHNRLVEAINAGRWALVHPLPQYRELSEYCWCSEDYCEGIRWALSRPGEVLSRIARGQTYIDGRFAPQVIAERWRAEIERVVRQ
jgi:hypothetical protein